MDASEQKNDKERRGKLKAGFFTAVEAGPNVDPKFLQEEIERLAKEKPLRTPSSKIKRGGNRAK